MNTGSRAPLPELSAASINARALHQRPMHPAIPTKAADTAGLADSLASGTPIAWRGHVCLLIGSGILATAPTGKAIISIPVIRDDLMLSPAFASLIIATFATLGTVFGLGAGIAIHRLDDRWSPILGMAAISIGSLIGAVAPNEVILLAARVFEGAGFLGVVLAIPSTLARIVPSADRQLVMAVWPAYMPIGLVVMMLLGPLLPTIGWQALWLATALLTGACSLALAIFAPRLPKAVAAEATDHFGSDIDRILCDPTCLMLAFAFFACTSLMFSLAFALPSLLISTMSVALGIAGMLSALVLAMTAIGHVASGFLLRAGVPTGVGIAAAFAGFALSAFVIYTALLPPPAIALAAAFALGLGGLVPGTLYAAADTNTLGRTPLPGLSAAFINARALRPYPTPAGIPVAVLEDKTRTLTDSITTTAPIAWRGHVCLLIASGVLATAQIGKAIISIPLIRDDMMLNPGVASLIVAAFATLGAFFGLGAGIAVPRLDDRRALILGMAVITIGSLIGAAAPNEAILLAARIFEGAGFLGVVLAIPSILARIVPSAQRRLVMAIWPTYMPAGMMLMLLLGPLLPIIGWRNLWLATALLTGGCCLALAIFAPRLPKAISPEPTEHFYSDIARILRDPTCLMLAFAFFAYTSLMFSLAFALPSLLTSTKNVALGAAGMLSALVLAMSAIGHLASGFLMRAGVPIWASIAAAFAAFAVSAFVIYAALPPPAIALAAAIALGLGGLAPGALYAAAPQAAPHPTAVAPTIGMLQQASNLGQFTGPLALGFWVAHFGWQGAPGIVAPAALLGITTAFAIRAAMRRTPAPRPPVILASSRL